MDRARNGRPPPARFVAIGDRFGAAVLLWRTSVGILAVLPIIVTIAHRAAPLVLVLSALFALLGLWREQELADLIRRVQAVLPTPIGVAAAVFLALAALSIAWSPAPLESTYTWGEFVLPVAATLILALTLPERAPRSAAILLGLSAAAAAALILSELATGQEVRQSLGMRSNSFIFNRPALTLLVLAPPLLWTLFRLGEVWLGTAVAVVLAAAILRSDSGAAGLGLVAGGLGFVIAWRSRKAAIALAVGSFVVAFAAAPVLGEVLHRTMPPSTHQMLSSTNSQARVDIWRSFGAAVRVRPFLGTGFSPGPAFASSAAAARVDPSYRTFLAVGHPHNAPLQVWAELGAAGAFLALSLLLLILRQVARLSPGEFAPSLALMGAAAAVSLVGHGVWQGWWPAVIGAAIVWFRIGKQLPRPSL